MLVRQIFFCLSFGLSASLPFAEAQVFIPDSLQQAGNTLQGKREGVWKFYAPSSGQLLIEGSYRGGKPEGKWFWYAAGRVFFEQTYRSGIAEGWGRWYAEGKPTREQWFGKGIADSAFAFYNRAGHYALRGTTEKDRPRGTWQVYFPNGNLAAEWNWFAKGAYHGASQWYYPDGKLLAKGHFLTGLAEGRWEFHSQDKRLIFTGNFKDGKPHGIWEIYGQEKLLHRLSLKEGIPDGKQIRYGADGNPTEEIFYLRGRLFRLDSAGKTLLDSGKGSRLFKNAQGNYADGFLEGMMRYFHPSGERLLQNYRQNRPEGIFELRDKNGNLLIKGTYRDEKIDSLCNIFHLNGKPKAQGMLRAGKETGLWQFFYPNGKLQALGEYCNGLPEGKWTYYDENGRILAVGYLKNGCAEGEWQFYRNGYLTARGTYQNGQKHGAWTDYFPDGRVRATGNFACDGEEGEWRYFHTNGKLRQTEQWQAGKLLQISDFYTPRGKTLPKGTFKKGNGSRLIYRERRRFLGKWHLQASGNYKDGLPEGRWRYYDRKGRVQKERIFVQGKPVSDD